MKIARNMVVTIDYELKDKAGTLLDTSHGQTPLSYIQGLGHIIPGLEKALEGKGAGEGLKTVVLPQDGYGEYRKELIQDVPRDQFDSHDQIHVGMQFEANTEDGPQVFQVVDVQPDKVKLDGNHPLAGKELHFSVKVVEVRQATKDELVHGHVHGPGGHHH